MLKETRITRTKDGIESVITDAYSNARNQFEASKVVLGRYITREEYEIELASGRLIVEEAVDYKWYVCYSDNKPLVRDYIARIDDYYLNVAQHLK